MSVLFQPLQAGALLLPNRILMAPLTRCRAEDGHIPGDLMATYYAQRASAGLLIAEATMAIEGNSAFWHEPGIHNAAQVAGWKKVTAAVHKAGGRIVLQIWHGGRACHPLLNGGAQPVAPSALPIRNDEVHTPEGKKPYVTPRELRDDELPGIVAAVVNKDQILYLKAFGKQNVGQNIPMAKTTIFRIASMTKPVTSVAIMMLVEQGRLRLDDPISNYLPEYKGREIIATFNEKDGSYTTRPAKREITIRRNQACRSNQGNLLTYALTCNPVIALSQPVSAWL